jgi:integrase
MQLYDQTGQRKYLTPAERQAFLRASESATCEVRTFCATLVHTGCRITEALSLTAARVDFAGGVLIFETLKKRRKGVFRAVPVPPEFLETLDQVHGLRRLRLQDNQGADKPLWDWSRTTGWRRVCEIMEAAGIMGLHASPKGLRHGFGVKAVTSEVPLNMTKKWLGHANLATTAIYADAVGAEEQQLAKRMWSQ